MPIKTMPIKMKLSMWLIMTTFLVTSCGSNEEGATPDSGGGGSSNSGAVSSANRGSGQSGSGEDILRDWTVKGKWAVSEGLVKNKAHETGRLSLVQSQGKADSEIQFDYINHTTAESLLGSLLVVEPRRDDDQNRLMVVFHAGKVSMQNRHGGVVTDLGRNGHVDSPSGTRFHVRIVLKGDSISVFRTNLAGEEEEEVLSYSGADLTQLTTGELKFWMSPKSRYSIGNISIR